MATMSHDNNLAPMSAIGMVAFDIGQTAARESCAKLEYERSLVAQYDAARDRGDLAYAGQLRREIETLTSGGESWQPSPKSSKTP